MEPSEKGGVIRVTPLLRRRAFFDGRIIDGAMPRRRDAKPQASYVQKPERVHPKGGNYRPRKKKLTGSVPLKVRKAMVAAKIRKSGCRTVAGIFAVRKEAERKAAIRSAKRRAERERAGQLIAA